jgi:hypothetical protein
MKSKEAKINYDLIQPADERRATRSKTTEQRAADEKELEKLKKKKEQYDQLGLINICLEKVLVAMLTADSDQSQIHALFVSLTAQIFTCH